MLVTLVGLSGLIVAHQLIAQTDDGTDTRPNILVFVSDDMGWGQPGFNGGTEVTTPHMDRLADEGVKLTQFYVQPVCAPTRASLFTGRYAWKTGMAGNPADRKDDGLLLDERTIAEALRDSSYATWLVGKWHAGHWGSERLPLQRGFDHHYGFYDGYIDSYKHVRPWKRWHEILDWHRNGRPVVESGYSTFLLAEEASQLIERHDGSRPFFLYVAFNAPHDPYQAPPEYIAQFSHLPYDLETRKQRAMVKAMDDAIGQVVDALERRGVLDETLVMFLNDNGGESEAGGNSPYRGLKRSYLEGGIRVPAVMRWPSRITAGSASDALMHVADLFPTFAGLAGADTGGGLPLDGLDVWEAIANGAESPREEVVHSLDVIRVGDWKLLEEDGEFVNGVKSSPLQLYNIAEDPYETTNLASSETARVAELRERLVYHRPFARDAEPGAPIPGLDSIDSTDDRPVMFGEEENTAFGTAVQTALTQREAGNLGPALLRLEASGTSLKLIYNETLDAASVPSADAFTVVLNPGYRPAAVTEVEVSESEVVLTLAQATVSGDIVGLTYEVPASGAIQDVDGLAANGVTWISVEEEADPPPAISAVHSGDGALTVVWTAPDGVTGITAYDLRWILTSADETVDANWAVVEDVWTEGLLNHVLLGLTDGAEYDIQVRAVNAKGGGAWSLTATGGTLPNGSPVTVGTLAARTLEVADGTVNVRVSGAFRDPDGDALTYDASSSAPSIVRASVTGSQLTLTPKTAGSAVITVTATDAGGSNTSATQTFDVEVANRSPVTVGTLADRTLEVADGTVDVQVSGAFRDPDADALTFAASSSAPSVVGASVTGSQLTLTPKTAGSAVITVTATDAGGSNTSATQTFDVEVANRSPVTVGTLADRTLEVADGTVDVQVSGAFRDPDADALTFAASSSSSSIVTVSVTGSQLTLTPKTAGSATITVMARDAGGSNTSATQTFDVEVANRSPVTVGTLADRSLEVADGTVNVQVSGAFRDPDGDALTFRASSSASSVVGASVTGSQLTLNPKTAGSAVITVTATDADGSNTSATQTFAVEVANRAPLAVGTLVDQSLRVGDGAVEVDVSGGFDDADSDTLTHDASSSAPGTASVMMSGAEVTITPAAAGDAQITVTATDVTGSNTSATQRFRARVAAARGVLLSVEALSVKEGSSETYSVVLDAAPTGPVTVTVDVPSGADLSVSPSSLTFTTGNWNRAQTVTVEAEQDDDSTADPTVSILHQVSGGDYGSVTAPAVDVTIVEDDTPTLSVEDAEASEGGGAVVFRVELSLAGTSEVTVEYETSDGSGADGARSGSDYTAASGTLTFAAGSTATQEVRVAVTDDSEDEEEAEWFGFTLRNVTNGSLAGGGSTLAVAGTILDNDDPSVVASFGSGTYSVVEGSGETVSVRLDRDPERTVTIRLVKVHQGGASTNDYTGIPPSVAFGSGETAREFVFGATNDSEDDDGESVVLRFGSLPNRVSGAGETRLEIVDNDDPDVTVSFGASRYEAPEGGGVQVVVGLSADPERTLTVPLEATPQGGATLADYTGIPSRVTFGSGETETEFRFEARDDLEDDDDESVLVRFWMLPSEVNGSGEVTLAILDDDDPEVEVQFGALNYDVTEGGSVSVTLHLSADPERTVTIPLEASHHGGATEADYSGLSDVTFNRGDTEKAFTLSAANDAEDDDGEAVVLRFGALPMGVSGSGETTVAILDTDDSGGGGGGGGGGPPPSDDEDDEDDDGGGTQPPPPPPPSGPPKAAYTLTAECAGDLCRARTGLPVTFEDTSTGRVQSRRWDFGDGTGSRNRRIDHAWAEPGFYEVTLSVSDGTTTSTAKQVFLVEASDPAGTCVPDAETLCLQDSRYAVTVEWRTADGGRGPGSVVHEGTNDSGLFTFFSADNWEVLIKVLDGCAVNGHVWVYGASTTDLGYSIEVTDRATGAVKEYRNEPGLPAPAITDGSAFPEGCQP